MRRSLPERGLAWLYTGPLGRLWGTLADVVVLWVRWGLATLGDRIGSQAAGRRSQG